MTAIVGLEHGSEVFIGGDSACAIGFDVDVYRDPKVFRVGDIIMGYCGSPRFGQLLRHAVVPPVLRKRSTDEQYVCVYLIAAIRKALEKNGYVREDATTLSEGDSCILGYRGQVYVVAEDYQALRPVTGIASIGSGSDIARGALWVDPTPDPRIRIYHALDAASRFNAGVRPPFTIVSSVAP